MTVQKQGSRTSEGLVSPYGVSGWPGQLVLALTARARSGVSGALVPSSCLVGTSEMSDKVMPWSVYPCKLCLPVLAEDDI